MARNPFVAPTTVRLPLAGGDWIEVKARLTAGEYHDRLAREYRTNPDNGKTEVDTRGSTVSIILAYVVDWSYVDDKGAPVPFTEDALRAVDVDTWREIRDAVQAHDLADEVKRSEEKNARAGSTSVGPT